MNLANWIAAEIGQGLLRNALIAGGTWLVRDGFLSQADLEKGAGAVVIIAGLVASGISSWQKAHAKATVSAATANPQIKITPAASMGDKPKVDVMPPPSLTTSAF